MRHSRTSALPQRSTLLRCVAKFPARAMLPTGQQGGRRPWHRWPPGPLTPALPVAALTPPSPAFARLLADTEPGVVKQNRAATDGAVSSAHGGEATDMLGDGRRQTDSPEPRTHGLRTTTRGQSGHTRADVGWVAGAACDPCGAVLHAGSGFWVQSRAPEASAEAPKARAHECQCIWRESSQTWRRQDVRVRVDESSHGGSAQAQRGGAPFASGARAEGRGLEVRCPEGPGSRRQPGEGPGAESAWGTTPCDVQGRPRSPRLRETP